MPQQAYQFRIDTKAEQRNEGPVMGGEPVQSTAITTSQTEKAKITPTGERDVNIVSIVGGHGQPLELRQRASINAVGQSGKAFGYLFKGTHTLTIHANDLPSGIYFYTITAGENKVTRKMIVG